MSGRKSRSKGKRGELEVAGLVHGKRTGYTGTDNPDVTTDFARYSVKNEAVPISLVKALRELLKLQSQDGGRHHFVAVKVNHRWLVIETMEQHIGDHVGGQRC